MLIQHLNVIVDPQAKALTGANDQGGVTGGPNTLPGGGGPDGTGTFPDPTEAGRNPDGDLVRFGGTGVPRVKRKNQQPKTLGYAISFAWSSVETVDWQWSLSLNGTNLSSGTVVAPSGADAYGFVTDSFSAALPADNPQPSSTISVSLALFSLGPNTLRVTAVAGGNTGTLHVLQYRLVNGQWVARRIFSGGYSVNAITPTADSVFTIGG